MAIAQSVCSSFKRELLMGQHDFTTSTGHTFKLALYPSTATIDGTTTAYSSTGEITATGYTAGGNTLTVPASMPSVSGAVAWTDFNDSLWTGSTISGVRGALIYNSSVSNKSVVTLDFGFDKAASSGDFTIVFPPADSVNAIIRIA